MASFIVGVIIIAAWYVWVFSIDNNGPYYNPDDPNWPPKEYRRRGAGILETHYEEYIDA